MSTILYYSNYCDNCKSLLSLLSRSKDIQKQMHFLCVDSRVKEPNGAVYLSLDNGQRVLLPPTVVKVPALLLLNRGHQVLFGEDIVRHIKPEIEAQQHIATKHNGEPLAFSLGGMSGGFGVASDTYSFLDQGADELAAQGTGGMRQQHHYASVTYKDSIETPPDTYSSDTIGNVSMEQLQMKRENDVRINR
jgi:hypothetical protein